MEPPTFHYASDRSLLVRFGDVISAESMDRVARLTVALESAPPSGIVNFHPAYNSILVVFDALRWDHAGLESLLRERIEHPAPVPHSAPPPVEIPVCYGGEYGPDLAEVAARHGLRTSQVAERHASVLYTVAFLGFAPGFAYLAGLPESLATPRMAKPRARVPAGAVGIAGNQTGIYPCATPGGWRIIGRTPLAMFEAGARRPNLLAVGDRVRFVPVTPERFRELPPR